MTFQCRKRGQPCIDDVCRSMNDCAWPPDELARQQGADDGQSSSPLADGLPLYPDPSIGPDGSP